MTLEGSRSIFPRSLERSSEIPPREIESSGSSSLLKSIDDRDMSWNVGRKFFAPIIKEIRNGPMSLQRPSHYFSGLFHATKTRAPSVGLVPKTLRHDGTHGNDRKKSQLQKGTTENDREPIREGTSTTDT